MTVAPRRALGFVLVTIFIDTVGFGIIIPVLPGLLMNLLDGTLSTAALYGGWLMFLFSALQFLSALVLGNLSDHYGRRPVLLGSLAAAIQVGRVGNTPITQSELLHELAE